MSPRDRVRIALSTVIADDTQLQQWLHHMPKLCVETATGLRPLLALVAEEDTDVRTLVQHIFAGRVRLPEHGGTVEQVGGPTDAGRS